MARRYEAITSWHGSTGLGWDGYERAHQASAPPAEQPLTVTTGEDKGDPRQLNPEQLLVMAASSCQLLWFLHLAAKARVDVVEYEDRAEADMPHDRITEITLRPRIVVAFEHPEERLYKLAELAHERCNIANSLSADVSVEPTFETRRAA